MTQENKTENPVLWHNEIPQEIRDSFIKFGGRKLSIVAFGIKRASQFNAHPDNYRLHPKSQQRAVEGSLASLGWVDIAIENFTTGNLIDGHERIWNALKNDDGYVPYIQVDLTEAEEAQALLTLDPIAEMAQTDKDKMKSLMLQVKESSNGSLDNENVKEFLSGLADENRIENPFEEPKPEDPGADLNLADELQKKWGVESGQLWKLGDHRLICGDCTDEDVVERLMGGEKVELVLIDPPYGVGYADKNVFLNAIGRPNSVEKNIKNDNLDKSETQDIWFLSFSLIYKVMGNGAVIYCHMPQGGDQMMMMMMMMMMKAGIEPRHEIIWLKNNHVLGRVDYAYKHEPILYAWKEGGHKFYGDFQTSIIEVDKPINSDYHPTMKPVELLEILIKNSSLENEFVLDTFIGSGTTLIACERLNRKCFGIEIDPSYCAVILERYFQMTGNQPELIG